MSGKSLKTGLFSGSFNPIHIGHLALANYLCEFEGLDEVWFLVTPHNPLKERDRLIDDKLRLQLVEKAIGNYPKFKVSDFEFQLPRPSYTIHTLEALQTAYPERTFYFIMGADNWNSISQWKEASRLLRSYNLLIYPRKGFLVTIPAVYPNIRYVEAPLIEISSSFIREAIKNEKDVRFFLPPGIYETCIEALCTKKQQQNDRFY